MSDEKLAKRIAIARAMGYMWVLTDTDCRGGGAKDPHQCLWPSSLISTVAPKQGDPGNMVTPRVFSKIQPGVAIKYCLLPEFFSNWTMRTALCDWICKHKPKVQERFIGHLHDVVKMRDILTTRGKNPIAIEAKMRLIVADPQQIAEAVYRTVTGQQRERQTHGVGEAGKD